MGRLGTRTPGGESVGCSQKSLTTRFGTCSFEYPQVQSGRTHSRSEVVSGLQAARATWGSSGRRSGALLRSLIGRRIAPHGTGGLLGVTPMWRYHSAAADASNRNDTIPTKVLPT